MLTSCEKLLDKDISSDKLNIISPGDSLETPVLAQTFWWNKLDGATSYNLQIVSPSFENPTGLPPIDTTITGNRIAFPLKENTNYQWRISAKNGYSNTKYIVRSLFITKNDNLALQSIIGMIPKDKDSVAISSDGNAALQWTSIKYAQNYVIKIDTLATGVTKNILTATILNDTTTTVTIAKTNLLKKGGAYKWSVQAFNAKSHTSEMINLPTFKVKK